MKPKAHARLVPSSRRSESPTAFAGHSATVELRIADNVFCVGQLGPDFIILHEAADHPPALGEMMLRIDGCERRWHVHLPVAMSSKVAGIRTQWCGEETGKTQ